MSKYDLYDPMLPNLIVLHETNSEQERNSFLFEYGTTLLQQLIPLEPPPRKTPMEEALSIEGRLDNGHANLHSFDGDGWDLIRRVNKTAVKATHRADPMLCRWLNLTHLPDLVILTGPFYRVADLDNLIQLRAAIIKQKQWDKSLEALQCMNL